MNHQSSCESKLKNALKFVKCPFPIILDVLLTEL